MHQLFCIFLSSGQNAHRNAHLICSQVDEKGQSIILNKFEFLKVKYGAEEFSVCKSSFANNVKAEEVTVRKTQNNRSTKCVSKKKNEKV